MTPPEASTDNRLATRIVEVATRCFAQRGYGMTSIREVVEEVGCTKPALYYYFGSKEGLFLHVVQAHMAAFNDMIAEAARSSGTVREGLAHSINVLIAYVQQHPDAIRLVLTAHHRPDVGQPQIDLSTMHRRQCEQLGGLLAQGVQSGEVRPDVDLADAVMALVGMINIHLLNHLDGVPLPDRMADRLLNLFFQGVGP